jgi:hypothetical protein
VFGEEAALDQVGCDRADTDAGAFLAVAASMDALEARDAHESRDLLAVPALTLLVASRISAVSRRAP